MRMPHRERLLRMVRYIEEAGGRIRAGELTPIYAKPVCQKMFDDYRILEKLGIVKVEDRARWRNTWLTLLRPVTIEELGELLPFNGGRNG